MLNFDMTIELDSDDVKKAIAEYVTNNLEKLTSEPVFVNELNVQLEVGLHEAKEERITAKVKVRRPGPYMER